MKFSEYPYKRPNYEEYKAKVKDTIQELKEADSGETAQTAAKKMSALISEMETASSLAIIRHTINTKDPFYDKEDQYWNEHHPLYTEIHTEYYQAVLDSAYRKELEEVLPETFFKMAEFQLRAFDPSVIDLLQKENDLSSQYQKLIAAAQIPYDGKTLNLSQFGPYLQSTDREVRKSSSKAQWGYFEEHEAEFDRIYDEMIKVRTEIAHKLGFKDFVELGYTRMMRFDYDREMVQTF